MPEPFKNFFNPNMVAQMGGHLARVGAFDADGFAARATAGLEPLELKERSVHIRQALVDHLPSNFEAACDLMVRALHPETSRESGNEMDADGIAGWAVMPMADVVATLGLGHHATSMVALGEMTKRFSAEFAVRPFFITDQEATLAVFKKWAREENFHLRRLASEGSRPRLPWGLRLQSFVEDPTPILPILEQLKDDPEEYVRRSVANNLNDISKDHPDLVAQIAGDWLKDASTQRTKLVKHACRGLVKDAHPKTLQVLGYGRPRLHIDRFDLAETEIAMGGTLAFEAEITSLSDAPQPLMIDYVVHHRKANGSTSPKVFKLKIAEIAPGKTLTLKKSHAIKPITTRVYYAGTHFVELQINGESFGKEAFELNL